MNTQQRKEINESNKIAHMKDRKKICIKRSVKANELDSLWLFATPPTLPNPVLGNGGDGEGEL